jgi:hypothetical protein
MVAYRSAHSARSICTAWPPGVTAPNESGSVCFAETERRSHNVSRSDKVTEFLSSVCGRAGNGRLLLEWSQGCGAGRSGQGVVEPVEGSGPEDDGCHALAVPFGSLGPGEEAELFRAGQVIEQLFALAG